MRSYSYVLMHDEPRRRVTAHAAARELETNCNPGAPPKARGTSRSYSRARALALQNAGLKAAADDHGAGHLVAHEHRKDPRLPCTRKRRGFRQPLLLLPWLQPPQLPELHALRVARVPSERNCAGNR